MSHDAGHWTTYAECKRTCSKAVVAEPIYERISHTSAVSNQLRLRIAVVDVAASSGGALSILQDLTSYLTAEDVGVEWVFLVSSDAITSSVPWVRIVHTSWPKSSIVARILWELVGARRVIEKAGVDGILSMQNMTIIGCSQPQIVYVHQPLPFATWMHWSIWRRSETELALRARLQKPLIVHSVRAARRTIVQTQWMKKAVAEAARVPLEKITVVRPVTEARTPDVSVTVYHDTASTPDFFFPAAPVKYKDHASLLHAVKILQDEGIACRVLLTVKGNENTYARHIATEVKALHGAVALAGQLPREEILDLYTRAILVFPSQLETFGLPLLEARRSGGWIVAADTPFAREILEGYSRAIFSKPGSPEELAKNMQVAWHDAHDSKKAHQPTNAQKFVPDNASGWGDLVSIVKSVVSVNNLTPHRKDRRHLQ